MQKVSLRRRLIALIVVAIGCAQALVTGVTLWQEAGRYAKTKKDTLIGEARVLAAAVSRATAAHDQATIYAALRGIGAIPDLTFVGVEDVSGHEQAELGAAEILSSDLSVDDSEAPLPIAQLFVTRSIVLRVPIVDGGRVVGRLALVSDARDLKGRLQRTLGVSALALAVSLLVALIIAWRMQRAITRPLDDLTSAMQSVAARHDYSLSLRTSGVREVTILVDGFNTMLGEVRERDDRIARSYADLENQVAERTADLRVAKDAAETANAQKSDFLATMSHEIRTPMNGMLVMAELLAHSQLPVRSQRYADVIWRSGQGLLAIINDILDFSKIEAGKLELEAVPVNLVEIVGTVVDLFAEKARSKGLDLATRVAVDIPPSVEGDPVRLNQILSNLVNNALKFTETGGVLLDVACDPDDASRLRFSVIDTGIGIAADKIGSVFGAFSQADQSTTRRYGGTGLGLAICRKLVEAMGSVIEVRSTLGEGSTFFFSVALDAVPAQTRSLSAIRPPAPAHIVLDLPRPMTSRALRYYMSEAGYAVDEWPLEVYPGHLTKGTLILTDASCMSAGIVDAARRAGCRIIALLDRGADVPPALEGRATLSWPVAQSELSSLLSALAEGREIGDVQARRSQVRDRYTNVRALVADDNEVNREVAKEALGRLGVVTDLVEDGHAAVLAAASKHYDVIFMDGSMPVLDGFAATRKIREAEQLAGALSTPIVALTADVLGTASSEWVDAGMDAMLSKPFTLEALARCLAKVLPADHLTHQAGLEHSEPVASSTVDGLMDAAVFAGLHAMAEPGRSSFVERVVAIYVERAPCVLDEIKCHAAACRSEALAKSAHALKSMSLNLGAKRVARLAASMEGAAAKLMLPDAAALDALSLAIERTCASLKAEASIEQKVA